MSGEDAIADCKLLFPSDAKQQAVCLRRARVLVRPEDEAEITAALQAASSDIVPPTALPVTAPQFGRRTRVPLQEQGGALVVPVRINDVITLGFVVDSGAADVTIPADVALTLWRTGTLTESDFLGRRTYELADGSLVPSSTFRMRTLKVGGIELTNVVASITNVKSSPLLGESFLRRFKSWSIDNRKRVLTLKR